MPSLLPHDLCRRWSSSHWLLEHNYFFFHISGKHLLHLYISPVWTPYTCCQKLRVFAVSQCTCVCSVVSDSVPPHGLYPASLLCPWDFLGKNTGVGFHSLLQGALLTQGSDPHLQCLLHWQAHFLPLSHRGSPESGNNYFFFFFFILRVFKIYSCSNVQVSDTVFLSIITMRSQILEIPELIPAGSLYPLTSISPLQGVTTSQRPIPRQVKS